MSINESVTEPTETPFVALSEALTWIAFRHSLDDAEMRAGVIGEPVVENRTNDERLRDFFSSDGIEPAAYANNGLGAFEDREEGLARLMEAWAAIRTEVDRGGWEVRGRYTPTYSASEAQLAEPEVLAGLRLTAFAQFDISTGGIRRKPSGQPTVIWEGHQLAYDREWDSTTGDDRARDGYLMVEVRRDALLSKFPASVATVRLTHDQVVAWCRNWIAEGHGNGMDKAWPAFRAEPAHAGLSRDDVFRPAWIEAKRQ